MKMEIDLRADEACSKMEGMIEESFGNSNEKLPSHRDVQESRAQSFGDDDGTVDEVPVSLLAGVVLYKFSLFECWLHKKCSSRKEDAPKTLQMIADLKNEIIELKKQVQTVEKRLEYLQTDRDSERARRKLVERDVLQLKKKIESLIQGPEIIPKIVEKVQLGSKSNATPFPVSKVDDDSNENSSPVIAVIVKTESLAIPEESDMGLNKNMDDSFLTDILNPTIQHADDSRSVAQSRSCRSLYAWKIPKCDGMRNYDDSSTSYLGKNWKPLPICPFCEQRFRKVVDMAAHVKTVHNSDTPYKCPVCPRLFRRSYCVTRHIRGSRQEEKNLKCRFCDRRFVRGDVRTAHEKIVHCEELSKITGNSCVKCKTCKKSFYNKAFYDRHVKFNKRSVCGKAK